MIDQWNSKSYYNIDETLMGDQRSSSERVITVLNKYGLSIMSYFLINTG